MYLVSLELKNVRAIRHMLVDFRKPESPEGVRRWTVLLGENGCGKSTVLKSIGLLLAGSEALSDLLGEPDEWIRVGEPLAELTAIIQTAEREERQVSLVLNRGDRRDTVIRNNVSGLYLLDAAVEKADRNYFIAGYGAFRRPPDPKRSVGNIERGRAAQLATLFSSSQDLVNLEQWAMDVDYTTSGTGREIIRESLGKLLPDMTFKDIDKQNRSVIMSTIDGDVPLRQLSEGYQAMAAWAGDLLYRMTETFRDRARPLEARGVLLLDEMDLHLHPVWKRNLVEFLNSAFPNLQIVSTTHSPLSIQECGEGELFVVKREEKSPTLIPFRGDPSKLRLSDLFLSPLIGLDTLDSPRVASLRQKARDIELKAGKKSPTEIKQLQEIGRDLEGTDPLPVEEAPGLKQIIEFQNKLKTTDPALLMAENDELFFASARPKSIAKKPLTRKSSGELRRAPSLARPQIKTKSAAFGTGAGRAKKKTLRAMAARSAKPKKR